MPPKPPMTKKATNPSIQGRQISGTLRKVFTNPEGAPPFPVFINAADFVGMGPDILLDVGVVTPENVTSAKAAGGDVPPVIDIQVIARFAMSTQTAALIHERLSMVLEHAKEMKLAGGEKVDSK
jgi:predicted metal-dependent peptidase